MAFSNGLKSPREEQQPQPPTTFPTSQHTSPVRTISGSNGGGGTFSPHHLPSASERGGLHRRFTTNAVPTLPTLGSLAAAAGLSPIGQQRRQAAEPQGGALDQASIHKVQLLQRKKEEYQQLKQQRERFKTEMELMDIAAKTSEHEMQHLASELYSLGHQSEPTTPPEYHDPAGVPTSNAGFPTSLSRPNRLSLASLTSPPKVSGGFTPSHRNTLSGSHHSLAMFGAGASVAAQQHQKHRRQESLLDQSRRGSQEELDEDGYDLEMPKTTRRAAVRNSMPVTSFDYTRVSLPDIDSVLGINSINSLLDEDDYPSTTPPMLGHRHTASVDTTNILRAETTDDNFPVLVRRSDLSQPDSFTSGPDLNAWPAYSRHRPGQQSLPMNSLQQQKDEQENGHHSRNNSYYDTPTRSNRLSLEASFNGLSLGQPARSIPAASTAAVTGSTMPSLRSSLSTNDIPTIGNIASTAANNNGALTHAEQHFQNHNAQIGRIPRHTRESSIGRNFAEKPYVASTFSSTSSTTVTPYTPTPATSGPQQNIGSPVAYTAAGAVNGQQPLVTSAASPYAYYSQYPINPAMHASAPFVYGSPMPAQQAYYGAPAAAAATSPYALNGLNGNMTGRPRDSQQQVMHQRKMQDREEIQRWENTPLVELKGQILELSKDQHGCRHLQKEIEKSNQENIALILSEVQDHVVELMKDNFGNYLCQKLLEFCNEDQRALLINNAAPDMVSIATNAHGTRALQKMLEYTKTPAQIASVTNSLGRAVVELAQDINGNHVLQKCLNYFKQEDNQFIFDAICNQIINTGTHRHGCCVIQRCIDHASVPQKDMLIRAITHNAYQLVQDPYGNYVIQYILDQGGAQHNFPLCSAFRGHVVSLSKQKFSSNVIEKALRVSDKKSQDFMLDELAVSPHEMETLLRDPFANYVIQTALEYASTEKADRLWAQIIPIMTNLRNTPCGRRLATKLNQRGGAGGATRNSGGSQAAPLPDGAQWPLNAAGQVWPPQATGGAPYAQPNPTVPVHLRNAANRGPQPPYGNGYMNGPGPTPAPGPGGNNNFF